VGVVVGDGGGLSAAVGVVSAFAVAHAVGLHGEYLGAEGPVSTSGVWVAIGAPLGLCLGLASRAATTSRKVWASAGGA